MSTKSPEYDHEAFPKDKDRLLGKGRSGVVKKVKRISDGKVHHPGGDDDQTRTYLIIVMPLQYRSLPPTHMAYCKRTKLTRILPGSGLQKDIPYRRQETRSVRSSRARNPRPSRSSEHITSCRCSMGTGRTTSVQRILRSGDFTRCHISKDEVAYAPILLGLWLTIL
jgi:hypothetical protein